MLNLLHSCYDCRNKYRSLYGDLLIDKGNDAENMSVRHGPGKYPGLFNHWTHNTWHLTWPNPDEQSGFITFPVSPSGSVTGIVSGTFGLCSRVE